jgi:signal transduction histidine kinase
VRTSAASPNGSVKVEFADTGEGMTAEQRRRAFKSLLSTTKARGTGLGLAIVNRIIESHRGDISVESRRGQGTRITISLPGAGDTAGRA